MPGARAAAGRRGGRVADAAPALGAADVHRRGRPLADHRAGGAGRRACGRVRRRHLARPRAGDPGHHRRGRGDGRPRGAGQPLGAARDPRRRRRRADARGGRRRADPVHARDRARARRAAGDRLPEEVLRLVPGPRPLPAPVQGRAGAARDAGRGRDAPARGCAGRRRSAAGIAGRAARRRGRRRARPADLDLRRRLSRDQLADEPRDLCGREGDQVVDPAGDRLDPRLGQRRAEALDPLALELRRDDEQHGHAGRRDRRVRLRDRLEPAALVDRSERLGREHRRHAAVLLDHDRPVRLLELRRPATQRIPLVGQVGVPALERVVLPLRTCLGDRRLEPGRRPRAMMATFDERQAGCPFRKARGEPAPHAAAPREADERRPVDAELRQ